MAYRAWVAGAVVLGCLLFVGCEKSGSPDAGSGAGKGVAAPAVEPPATPKKIEQVAIDGFEWGRLEHLQQVKLSELLDSLPSPCGTAQSLRNALAPAADCTRSKFAARFVAMMVEDAALLDEIRSLYTINYVTETERIVMDLEKTPWIGGAVGKAAKLQLVEYYDYGCPACLGSKPVVDELLATFPNDLVVYFKQFPRPDAHPGSLEAASAALAANQQGKFKEMHDMLFANFGKYTRADIEGYAKALNLNAKAFAADMERFAAVANADREEALRAKIDSTPTFVINGKPCGKPLTFPYMRLALEEALLGGLQ